ncbi:MAG: L,D-transpeptidase [Gammaproteobacteria bacterium]|nr:L,D-transpeptidase [Gammaproteobacteria bacterium]MCF6229425.1 L,D-transpeptidase [Gammaproteobacteria bacterium]
MYSGSDSPQHIVVSIADQQLELREGDRCLKRYTVSTAENGPGEQAGSGCTPRGWHLIRAMMGKGAPENSVFVGRRASGEIYTPALAKKHPQRDWVLTRIMWLSGLEVGKNRLGRVDSMRRYIYIHGTPDELPMGKPLSHGCIRMRNRDIVALFALLEGRCKVFISEGPLQKGDG